MICSGVFIINFGYIHSTNLVFFIISFEHEQVINFLQGSYYNNFRFIYNTSHF